MMNYKVIETYYDYDVDMLQVATVATNLSKGEADKIANEIRKHQNKEMGEDVNVLPM